MNYYYINAEICESYPNYEFVLKARTLESATNKAHKIIKQDYPEDYRHAKGNTSIREVTAETLLAYLTLN
jgi:hypothetical protein